MTALSKHTEFNPDIDVATPARSAIEFIVETAQPGEVISISDADYYNDQLWRSYESVCPPVIRAGTALSTHLRRVQ